MNARNQAESPEQSRFPSPKLCVEFCLVGSLHAGWVFEWTIAHPVVHDDPWYHINQWCICALTLAYALTTLPTTKCSVRALVCCHRSLKIFDCAPICSLSCCRSSSLDSQRIVRVFEFAIGKSVAHEDKSVAHEDRHEISGLDHQNLHRPWHNGISIDLGITENQQLWSEERKYWNQILTIEKYISALEVGSTNRGWLHWLEVPTACS